MSLPDNANAANTNANGAGGAGNANAGGADNPDGTGDDTGDVDPNLEILNIFQEETAVELSRLIVALSNTIVLCMVLTANILYSRWVYTKPLNSAAIRNVKYALGALMIFTILVNLICYKLMGTALYAVFPIYGLGIFVIIGLLKRSPYLTEQNERYVCLVMLLVNGILFMLEFIQLIRYTRKLQLKSDETTPDFPVFKELKLLRQQHRNRLTGFA